MTFHLIITCVSQKKSKQTHSILDLPVTSGEVDQVFEQWCSMIGVGNIMSRPAKDLYRGQLWNAFMECWKIVSEQIPTSRLWVLSAGYGLISIDEEVEPYDITFQDPKNGVPSLLTRLSCGSVPGEKKKVLQQWWKLLSTLPKQGPTSLAELMRGSSPDDYFLFIVSKDYLDAVMVDLREGIWASPNPNQILIVSNSPGEKLQKFLGENWLYADGKFVNLPGTNSTTVNAKIARMVLLHALDKKGRLKGWTPESMNKFLRSLADGLPDAKKFDRVQGTDQEVEEYIRQELAKVYINFSKMHRVYRDSGRACEYTRFRSLYNKVKNDLKSQVNTYRQVLPISYKKRNAEMLFFLPDWDDRVDPTYDFENDRPTVNRDPYEHDAYHYELYGALNCDGILVSKSVLEANKEKKNRAKLMGIHRYLRLPEEVPVLGDCGAFNYIMDENPPYKTNEILKYYQELGFNYGVSIDHLIVPGILKRQRYLKWHENKWDEIEKEEFANLRNNKNTHFQNNRRCVNQTKLFPDGDIIIEETYIDEKERQRRYELTITNARDFIKQHYLNKCSFIPIGAVQGWNADSYSSAVNEYQKMGYSYIALGGLVRSTTKEIINILEAVNKYRKRDTRLHIFGVARLDAINMFKKLGVASVDSAGMLRQAWLSSSDNYYSPNMNHYTAIRVPPIDHIKVTKDETVIDQSMYKRLTDLEEECLSLLRKYDRGLISMGKTLRSISLYDSVIQSKEHLVDKYSRTLLEKPWQKCPCKLCRETGIDIIIFRRNNRNRRRGFHNTWVFFNKFKELTNIDRG